MVAPPLPSVASDRPHPTSVDRLASLRSTHPPGARACNGRDLVPTDPSRAPYPRAGRGPSDDINPVDGVRGEFARARLRRPGRCTEPHCFRKDSLCGVGDPLRTKSIEPVATCAGWPLTISSASSLGRHGPLRAVSAHRQQ